MFEGFSEHRNEDDFIRLDTDGTDAADEVRTALDNLGLQYTESAYLTWPDDTKHPILTVRLKELHLDTQFRGQGNILSFFVDAVERLRQRAKNS